MSNRSAHRRAAVDARGRYRARVNSSAPSGHVLAAFGATGLPVIEPGGQGRTWHVGDLILKPCDDPVEAAWTAEVVSTLVPSVRFRVAAPVAAGDGGWVVSGWQAWQAVTGEPDDTRCAEVLDVADAFHQAIARRSRPAFLDSRDDPWTYGDRVAWEELPINGHGVRPTCCSGWRAADTRSNCPPSRCTATYSATCCSPRTSRPPS